MLIPRSQTSSFTVFNECNSGSSTSQFSCQECPFSAITQEALVKHVSYVHKVPRPYQCVICSKRFRQKKCVVEHMRLHTGEKPYSCNVCLEKFHTYSSLHYHRRNHLC